MDGSPDGQQPDTHDLSCRIPLEEDLVRLCRELNVRGAKYVVIGGFAIIASGLARTTGDVDLLVAGDLDNEQRVFSALATLPDQAVKELQPGELQQHNVIRVADEILVDLMVSAGGVDYNQAIGDAVIKEIDGVKIPFASPRMLWRMKIVTHREKDAGDLYFLRYWFEKAGEQPPRI